MFIMSFVRVRCNMLWFSLCGRNWIIESASNVSTGNLCSSNRTNSTPKSFPIKRQSPQQLSISFPQLFISSTAFGQVRIFIECTSEWKVKSVSGVGKLSVISSYINLQLIPLYFLFVPLSYWTWQWKENSNARSCQRYKRHATAASLKSQ